MKPARIPAWVKLSVLAVATGVFASLQIITYLPGFKLSIGADTQQYNVQSGGYVCLVRPSIPTRGWPLEYYYGSFQPDAIDCGIPDLVTNGLAGALDGFILVLLLLKIVVVLGQRQQVSHLKIILESVVLAATLMTATFFYSTNAQWPGCPDACGTPPASYMANGLPLPYAMVIGNSSSDGSAINPLTIWTHTYEWNITNAISDAGIWLTFSLLAVAGTETAKKATVRKTK